MKAPHAPRHNLFLQNISTARPSHHSLKSVEHELFCLRTCITLRTTSYQNTCKNLSANFYSQPKPLSDGEYLLENQGQQAANVRIEGEPWEGVTAQKLDAQAKILGQTNTVTESNFLRVTVASESRYKLSSIFIND